MCAIGGVLSRDAAGHALLLKNMSAAMSHRGPDGEGFAHDGPCSLLHRLLRIVSPKTMPGPYLSRDGRWLLTFNGEIYNHEELRRRLQKEARCEWRHTTDAEVLLEGWALRGESFLQEVNGMFAFAIWDRHNRRLFLARDRLGEKPLYFYASASQFLFASEVKGILKAGVKAKLHHQALGDFLAYRYVPGPSTLFAGINKLAPAHILEVDEKLFVQSRRYWAPETRGSEKGHCYEEELRHLLAHSHSLRTVHGWKPTFFLSGGIDSATIASHLPTPSEALTFSSPMTLCEVEQAKQIAERFGHSHREVRASEPWENMVKKSIWALEEPLGDSIILPTWALAQEASRHTRVVYSGEGADEIFAGYVHHWVFHHLIGLRRRLGARGFAACRSLLKILPANLLKNSILYPANAGHEGRDRLVRVMERLTKGAGAGSALTTLFAPQENSRRHERESHMKSLDELMRLDLDSWLPDYTLLRLDKVLMHFGVESRLPFLDHRVVELAMRLSPASLIRGQHRKWILRRAMAQRLGAQNAWRKKTPFLLQLTAKDPAGHALLQAGQRAARNLRERNLLRDSFSTDHGNFFLDGKRLFSLYALETWLQQYEVEV